MRYFRGGEGPRVTDVDGNVYLDYGLAWGPLILGHSPAEVIRAVQDQLPRGLTFGAQHELEFEVAERLVSLIPCADKVCFANSGTEIVQVALRLARAAIGRQRYLKFEGHYHGWDDSVLVSYHPAAEQLASAGSNPVPVGRGQPPSCEALVAQWNDFDGVRVLFESHPGEISAILCEPLLCNSFCTPPAPGFLELLREISARSGALLIFDEVVTGFRIHLQGAQGHYGAVPDLATYAKAVGAGTPLSVLAGAEKFMDLIARGEVIPRLPRLFHGTPRAQLPRYPGGGSRPLRALRHGPARRRRAGAPGRPLVGFDRARRSRHRGDSGRRRQGPDRLSRPSHNS